MSQVTEQSVRFQTALASIKLIQASAVLDLTEDDFDFLTSNKVWIATDRSRAQIGRAVQQECRDRKSGSAGMPRPISYAVFCLHKHRMAVREVVVSVDRIPLAAEVGLRALLGLAPALGHGDVRQYRKTTRLNDRH